MGKTYECFDRENFNFRSVHSFFFPRESSSLRFLFPRFFSTRHFLSKSKISKAFSCAVVALYSFALTPIPHRSPSYPKELTVERNPTSISTTKLLLPLLRVHRGKIRAVEGPRIKFFNNAIHRLERNHASKRSSRSKERWPSLALSRFSTLVLQFAGHAERGESRKERPPLPTLYEVSKTNFVAERSAT